MKVLITGANGMLGGDLMQAFEAHGHQTIGTDREDLDITNLETARAAIRRFAPDLIVNAAAYNFVDLVESEEHYPVAYAVNAEGPKNLAIITKELGIPLVQYSTDFVFEGTKPEGYAEDDAPHPISKYGETKLAGERLAQEHGGDVYIIRLSKLFGKPGKSDHSKESFVSLMSRLAKEKPELAIIEEEVGSPTYTPDAAEATVELIAAGEKPGIYHMVNSGDGVSWHAFAQEFFALQGITTPVKKVLSDAFPRPAKRPKFAALINTKIAPLPSRQDALKRFLNLS